jgi:arylsulfatase A-like enzyme
MHYRALLLVATSAVVLSAPLAFAGSDHECPNIILIMADDMGYSDIGCFGSEIQTPTLDRMAKEGVTFTQFYNGARCCPTRAALLTGLYAHQAGMGGMEPDWKAPGYRGNINRQCVTLAEALKANDYATYMTGKWHLTNLTRARTDEDKYNWPCQRGFDRFFGTDDLAGGVSTYHTGLEGVRQCAMQNVMHFDDRPGTLANPKQMIVHILDLIGFEFTDFDLTKVWVDV